MTLTRFRMSSQETFRDIFLQLTLDDMRAIARVMRAHVETLSPHDDPAWWELADYLDEVSANEAW